MSREPIPAKWSEQAETFNCRQKATAFAVSLENLKSP